MPGHLPLITLIRPLSSGECTFLVSSGPEQICCGGVLEVQKLQVTVLLAHSSVVKGSYEACAKEALSAAEAARAKVCYRRLKSLVLKRRLVSFGR